MKSVHKRIQKLIALSASDNEAEATLAMEKARELMDKHNIRTIDVNPVTEEADVKHVIIQGYGVQVVEWQAVLSAAIAKCFDGHAVVNENNDTGGWVVIFFASNSEAVLIEDLYKRLRRLISRKGKLYSKSDKVRLSYAHGMVEKVYWRLKEIYDTMRPEDLALVSIKKDEIRREMESMFDDIQERDDEIVDRRHYRRGFEDGDTLNLGRSLNNKPKTRRLSHGS